MLKKIKLVSKIFVTPISVLLFLIINAVGLTHLY